MSTVKVRKNIFSICLGDARKKEPKKKALLIADSRGRYLADEISTEKFIDIKIISEPGLNINKTHIIWKSIKANIKKKDRAILFLWIAPCDLTTKEGKFISLTYNTSKYHSKIDNLVTKFSTLKAQIESRYKHTKVCFLECPPYSIKLYNKHQGHEDPNKFTEQTARLENQIFYLNRQIRRLNTQIFRVRSTNKPLKDPNNNSQTIKDRNKKSNLYYSPNFTRDLLRQTKFPGQKTKYYTDFKILKDGLHPSPLLSKLWIRKILKRVVELCY
ncbi:Hypothetical predicted protein [Mytilus galloprovincialis]|uniref:Uncharacterized protein n=1 Tax=Mytilus galloprovincialis TaxID=29158 RepID=A0A8B6EIS4_MYTGA|nr:Hypothetical predicted protein [Mytilus galloprovincialis]